MILFTSLNQSLVDNGKSFRFGYNGDNDQYGYYKADDSFVPFSQLGNLALLAQQNYNSGHYSASIMVPIDSPRRVLLIGMVGRAQYGSGNTDNSFSGNGFISATRIFDCYLTPYGNDGGRVSIYVAEVVPGGTITNTSTSRHTSNNSCGIGILG